MKVRNKCGRTVGCRTLFAHFDLAVGFWSRQWFRGLPIRAGFALSAQHMQLHINSRLTADRPVAWGASHKYFIPGLLSVSPRPPPAPAFQSLAKGGDIQPEYGYDL